LRKLLAQTGETSCRIGAHKLEQVAVNTAKAPVCRVLAAGLAAADGTGRQRRGRHEQNSHGNDKELPEVFHMRLADA
ncbi:MAG TPA: hypothetical protein PKA30_12905, partial [Accumulibacter sp.]